MAPEFVDGHPLVVVLVEDELESLVECHPPRDAGSTGASTRVFMSGRVGILAWFLAHRERFAHGLR